MRIIFDVTEDAMGPTVYAFQETPDGTSDGLELAGYVLYWQNKLDDVWVKEGLERFGLEETMKELAEGEL